jgi:hypothetical protein
LASFFSFLAEALPGLALALFSFFSFFFSPCVILVDLTKVFLSACFGGMMRLEEVCCCKIKFSTMYGSKKRSAATGQTIHNAGRQERLWWLTDDDRNLFVLVDCWADGRGLRAQPQLFVSSTETVSASNNGSMTKQTTRDS